MNRYYIPYIKITLKLNFNKTILCLIIIDGSASSESDIELQDQKSTFKAHLATWATKECISLKAMDSLLNILRTYGGHDNLPSSSRTLLETPRSTITKNVGVGGSYWHCGLKLGLIQFLEKARTYHIVNDSIDLMINIDGLPLYSTMNYGRF